jgi:membrane protein
MIFVLMGTAAMLSRRGSLGRSSAGPNITTGAVRLEATDSARDRSAQKPSEISAQGWWDILRRVQASIGRKNLSLISAGAAFFGFIAVPTALAALVSLYGLAFNPDEIGRQLELLAGVLPADTVKVVSDQLQSLTAKPPASIGIGFAIGLALALWSSRSATSSLITALNVAYDEEEKRSFVKFQATALGFTIGAVLFVVTALILVAVLPVVLDYLPLGERGKSLAAFLRWPALALFLMVALAALYRYAPCRSEPRWQWVSWGAFIATVVWIAGSAAFSFYVSRFGGYDKTYGPLGGIVVMLLWLYLSSFVVTLGAALNAEMERQTVRDTTTGEEEPMGQRKAVAADTLG